VGMRRGMTTASRQVKQRASRRSRPLSGEGSTGTNDVAPGPSARILRVGVAKVNMFVVGLDEPLDEAGFRHVAASVGGRLGARQIGASVYRAEAGLPIWPYHYHHGIEEWLYVIGGARCCATPQASGRSPRATWSAFRPAISAPTP
jgi:hypothetical protein